MNHFTSVASFEAALHNLPQPDFAGIEAASARQAELTKPAGSLGRLEEIAIFMAGWQGRARPKLERLQAAVFAGNHGVAAQGVSAFPTDVTMQMVANFQAGGAAINALAGACGAELAIIPIDLDLPTEDITLEAAMSEAECLEALSIGASIVSPDIDLLFVGEMGIGNTTPAAALCAQSYGGSAAIWTGRGSGVDDATYAHKTKAVEQALALHGPFCHSPFEILRRLGGREIAAMAGAILTARLKRVPVLLDGFICCAAIAPLAAASPQFTEHCLAGHCSSEAGHVHLLEALGLDPLLHLNMRLGEGSGAAVAAQIVRSAIAAHDGMASFAEAAVAKQV